MFDNDFFGRGRFFFFFGFFGLWRIGRRRNIMSYIFIQYGQIAGFPGKFISDVNAGQSDIFNNDHIWKQAVPVGLHVDRAQLQSIRLAESFRIADLQPLQNDFCIDQRCWKIIQMDRGLRDFRPQFINGCFDDRIYIKQPDP